MRARGSSGLFGTAVLVAAAVTGAGGTAAAGPVRAGSAAPARASAPTAAALTTTAPAPATARPASTQALRGPQAAAGTASSPVQAVSVRQAQAAVAAAATLSRADFTPVTPVRTLDTRNAIGAPRARVAAGRTITVQLTGRAGVPATGVGAVALSLTATGSAAIGFLTAYPAGAARPGAYSVTYAAGQNGTNLAVVKVSAAGQITLFTSATTDIVADVHGWYATTSTVHALTPARLLDTRTGNGAPAGALATNGSVDVQVTGRGGVPATGVVGAVLNLTGISSPTAGSMALFPTGTPAGLGALNLPARSTVSNLLFTRLGTGGKVTVLNRAGTTHATVDVVAWIGAGGQTHLITPERSYDTRTTGATGPIGSGGWLDVWMTGFGQVPVLGVHAVVANVTVVNPPANGTVVVHQQGLARPGAVSISYLKGRTTTTQVVAFVGAGGWIRLDNVGASVNFIIDTVAWYSADGSLGLSPNQTRQVAPSRFNGITINGVSADGRYTFFRSSVAAAPNAAANSLYVTDSLLGITQVTVPGSLTPAASDVSADGTSITFESASPNLWPGDVNAATDVFWYDLITNDVKLVTANTAGNPAGGNGVPLSSNARYAVFQSDAPQIVATQPTGMSVFVRDLVAGSTVRVGDCQTRATLCADAVSNDGSTVLFTSSPTTGVFTTFVWRRGTGVASPFLPSQPTVKITGLSDDGATASFWTDAGLAPLDQNTLEDVYTIDLGTGTTHLMTHLADGTTPFRSSRNSGLSADGALAMFESPANLVPPSTGPGEIIEVYRSAATGGPLTMVTKTAAGAAGSGDCRLLALAPSGNYAVISSFALNLGADNTGQTNYLLIRVR